MGSKKTEAIILKKYLLRETSFILSVFTREYGKVLGVIKGVRKPYPQFAGDYEIFTRCHIVFYKKPKSMDLITQVEGLESFVGIRKDIERLTYANYFIELILLAVKDYDINTLLYDNLVDSLQFLNTETSAKRVARIFEMKFLQAMGLTPELEVCTLCGKEVAEKIGFNVSSGGVVCDKCFGDKKTTLISLGTLKFLQKIQKSETKKLANIKVSREVGEEAEKVLLEFIAYYINRPIKSLKFLEKIMQK